MATNDEETFWVLEENDAFFAREVSGRNSRFKKGKEKEKQKANRAVPFRFKPYRKSGSGGKANMANENQDPYDQAYWGKGRGKNGRKETQSSNIPMMETKVMQPANQTAPSTKPTYAGWTDQDWDPSWNWGESGWYSPALMAFHDAFQQHEKEAIHEKLIQDDPASIHQH